MADYTFNSEAVYDAATDLVVENATGGKLVAYFDGPALPIFDLNDNPITEITSNPSGQSIMFKANVYQGLIQFGSVAVAVVAKEVADLAVSASTGVTTLNDLVAQMRDQLATVEANVQAILATNTQAVIGKGVTAVQAITQASYTALAVKDRFTLYLVKQADGSIVPQYLGSLTDPTPQTGTPTAPGGSVASVTETTITLGSLTAPSSNGGSAITGYRFFAYNPNGTSAATFNPEWVSSTQATLPSTFQFTSMVAGTAYQVGVFALNANGEGARLRLTGTTTAVTGGGGGTSGGAGLPSKVAAMWYNKFQLPRLRQIPTDVMGTSSSIINHVNLGMAQSGGSGTGNLAFGTNNGESAAELKADVLALRAAGANVCIGVGGSSDGGITITNSTQVTQAYNSIVSIVNNYGVNGLDIDLEPSGSSWNQASLVSLVNQLKGNYGASFVVGVTPGLYSPYTAGWLALGNALGANMDYFAPMLYDFPESRDSRLTAIAVGKCDEIVNGGIPASKIILGFMCRTTSATGDGYSASTPQVTLDAYNACVAKYPSIRGAFLWEQYIDASQNWAWARLTGKRVRGL